MLPYIDFNLLNKIVFLTGIISVIGTILLLIFIIIYRAYSIQKRYSIIKFYKTWNPIFSNVNSNIPKLPKVKKSDHYYLLKIWNKNYKNASIEKQTYLIEISKKLDIKNIAILSFEYKNSIYKLTALESISNLKSINHTNKLLKSIEHTSTIVSLMTIQTIIKISPIYLGKLTSYLIEKEEWHPNKIVLILKDFDKDEISKNLENEINIIDVRLLPRLIKLFDLIDKNKANELAVDVLKKYNQLDVIISAIPYLTNAENKNTLISFLDHKSWIVRMKAIKTLSNLLEMNDLDSVSKLLKDRSWWVRHHTASALVSQKYLTNDYFIDLENNLNDQYAIDALKEAKRKKEFLESV